MIRQSTEEGSVSSTLFKNYRGSEFLVQLFAENPNQSVRSPESLSFWIYALHIDEKAFTNDVSPTQEEMHHPVHSNIKHRMDCVCQGKI